MSLKNLRRSAFPALALLLVSACGQTTDQASEQTAAVATPASSTLAPATSDTVHDDGHSHVHGASPATAPTSDGFTLTVASPSIDAPGAHQLDLTITTDAGPVTSYDVSHEKQLHMMIVDHSLTKYMHVHPEMSADGTWSVPVDFPTAGFWRVVVDFQVDGKKVALGTDVVVGQATMTMANLTAESRISTAGPYVATISGDTAHEASRPLKVTITRDGNPVAEIEPYLGAVGHLVGFSAGGLGYVHMHANDGFVDGTMTFTAPALEHGFHKLFLEASIGGELRQFEFVIEGK